MPTGSDIMFKTALAAGIDTCFANPGTTEMAMVATLDRVDGMRAVLTMFEGVASGAADGFWRASGRPALGMFHLGPGFANALANNHNAKRGLSPIINLVGDQTTWHLPADAPLSSDTQKVATWAGWHRYVTSPNDISADTAAAICAATTGPRGPATLVIPADVTWEQAPDDITSVAIGTLAAPDPDKIGAAANLLHQPGAALIVGGSWLTAEMAHDATAIAAATGCKVFSYRVPNAEIGQGIPHIADIPYFPEQATQVLASVETAVLLGTPEPITFFGYPDVPSETLPPGARRFDLGGPAADTAKALVALVEHLGAQRHATGPVECPEMPTGALDVGSLGAAVVAGLPDDAIVVQEGITSAAGLRSYSVAAPPHRTFSPTGGAIGGGLPLAVGAACASPGRRIVSFQADGSSMYTIQSLWTMAREQLDVTVVLCNNQRYAILEVELLRAGIEVPGPKAASLTSLADPALDFTSIAAGMGVPSTRATTADAFAAAYSRANSEPGPHLIEAML
ncbi:MAG: acetolactate synthase large subunit [Actinomycetia bacterium]|nr:acetolactate synthase large subunit [Actinomycetes bacterium]